MQNAVLERIKLKDKEILLLGTAHVSEESVRDVLNLIEKEKPDCIALELDEARFQQLVNEKAWLRMNILDVVRKGKAYLLLFNMLLASMQRKIGKELGIKPGSEMLSAAKVAREKNIPIALVDRDINITMKRMLASMSFLEKLKLFSQILLYYFGFGKEISASEIEKLKRKDVLSVVIKELAKEFPAIKKVLVDERDLYIANKIKRLKAKKILAVIGAGHLEGVKKNLEKSANIKELETTPAGRNYALIFKTALPLIFILLVVLGVIVKGATFAFEAFFVWFLVNGVFSAVGAMLARAHWKSVLAAFLSSPLTSLHPMLAAGWFAALVEAKTRPIRVMDMETLNNLDSLSDFYKNRFAHVLVVAAMVNAASTIATFVAIYIIASML